MNNLYKQFTSWSYKKYTNTLIDKDTFIFFYKLVLEENKYIKNYLELMEDEKIDIEEIENFVEYEKIKNKKFEIEI